MLDLTGASALVTGGASGLGLSAARRLHAAGAFVTILDMSPAAGAQVSAELRDRVAFVEGDVTNSESVGAAVDRARDLGPLRVLVNCAGIGTPGMILRKGVPMPLEEFERVVRVNLIGTFNAIRLAAPAMVATDEVGEERGVIVNTASVAAFDGQIGQAAYAASKAGVAGLTLPLAREFARAKVRVATIAPGLFETPMLLNSLSQEYRDALGEQVPHPSRLGVPDEYAALVMHIIANPMLNGETIRLDGAIRMAPR
ncbi:SDR family NAD(P)-dependent oxidoreductase [Arthrobacter sp. B6]|uniref:SDR family NAD(P)-dependent oxidoreductase n=1 Tax=Arthrobacter sp. B6 TaxID=1570137 RepID=UPI00082AF492|nr:SDR family NAD(P)-dependent oxidoreductase [Arthrobacter sp. B6]